MFEQVVFSLPPEILVEFRQAITQGHWSNGMELTNKQRITCEQALFYHEHNSSMLFH
ncbi:MAG: DUF1315 family protein [Gammaproteobacteria bacterium]|nr:DUF1315 family protein [Gammaproteobacteria bacterium]